MVDRVFFGRPQKAAGTATANVLKAAVLTAALGRQPHDLAPHRTVTNSQANRLRKWPVDFF